MDEHHQPHSRESDFAAYSFGNSVHTAPVSSNMYVYLINLKVADYEAGILPTDYVPRYTPQNGLIKVFGIILSTTCFFRLK